MAHIRVIDEDEAEGRLFEIYDKVQKSRGRLSNIMRVQSLDPKALEAHLDLYMAVVYGKGPLSRRERELIAVVVSSVNGCSYCSTHHGEALDTYVKDPDWVKAVAADPDGVDLEPRERALVDYALTLTRTPGKAGKDAVAKLRGAGLEDDAILQATEVVAYFNFANRLASALGVTLEDPGDRDFAY